MSVSRLSNTIRKGFPAGTARQSVSNASPDAVTWTRVDGWHPGAAAGVPGPVPNVGFITIMYRMMARATNPMAATEFARLYHDLDGGMNLLAYFVPNAPLPSFKRRDQARLDVEKLLSKVMVERRRAREAGDTTEYEDFLQTLDVVERARFDSAYTFQYSPRPGTRAATMDGQIPREIVQERFDTTEKA